MKKKNDNMRQAVLTALLAVWCGANYVNYAGAAPADDAVDIVSPAGPALQLTLELRRQTVTANELLRTMRALLAESAALAQTLPAERRRVQKNDAAQKTARQAADTRAKELGGLGVRINELETELALEIRRTEEAANRLEQFEFARHANAQTEKLLADMETNRLAQEKRIRDLRRQTAVLEERRRELAGRKRETDSAQTEIAAAQRRHDAMMRQIEQTAAAADELEKTALQLERQLADTQQALADDETRHAGLLDARRQIKELLAAGTALERQAEPAQAILDATQKRCDDLRQNISQAEARREELRKQYTEFEKLRMQVTAQQHGTQTLEQEIAAGAENVAMLDRQAQSLRHELARVHHESDELARTLKTVQRVERELEKARAGHRATAERLQVLCDSRATLLAEIDARRNQIVALYEQIHASAVALAGYGKMRDELTALEAMRGDLEQRVNADVQDQQTARVELRKLAQQMDGLEQTARELTGQAVRLRETEASLNAAHKQRAVLEERVRVLESGRVLAPAVAPTAPAVALSAARPAAAAPATGMDFVAAEQKLIEAARRTADPSASDEAASAPPLPMTPVQLQADEYYRDGIARWDAGDVDGAIIAFKQTLRYDKEAAGAYYNLGVAYARKGENDRACRYGYDAGLCYLRNGNRNQALRMLVFIQTVDAASKLIGKLRAAIGAALE